MEFSTQQIGKFLILMGVIIALVGAVLMISGRIGLFKLPGDFVFSGKNWKIYLPIATSIIISIILTIILMLINYFRK
jgi:low affinity Fe/Cu permease